MARRAPDDPLWQLALEVADQLWFCGEYAVVTDRVPTQHLVDLQWAGYQAGRILGVRTEVEIAPCGAGAPSVVVRVTYVDPDGCGLVRAQQRLDALRRSVRAHQAGRAVAGRRGEDRHRS